MLLHFDDATSLTGAKLFRRSRLVILYGLHHTLELQCIAGFDNAPVDMQALGLGHWELNIARTLENPSSILASAIYETNIAVGDILSVEFSTATEAMYEYVAGGMEQPAVFELKGFESDSSEEASVVIQLPITLRTTVTDKCPQKLSDAMLSEMQWLLEQSRELSITVHGYEESAAQSATVSYTWAEGNDQEVALAGGTHSARRWNDIVQQAANAASTSAAVASQFAENAYTWAEGTDAAVELIGGTYSARKWAELAEEAAQHAGVLNVQGVLMDGVSIVDAENIARIPKADYTSLGVLTLADVASEASAIVKGDIPGYEMLLQLFTDTRDMCGHAVTVYGDQPQFGSHSGRISAQVNGRTRLQVDLPRRYEDEGGMYPKLLLGDTFTVSMMVCLAEEHATSCLLLGADEFSLEMREASINMLTGMTDHVSATDISSGWHFVCVTYDGTRLKLYIDGQQDMEVAVELHPMIGMDSVAVFAYRSGPSGINMGYKGSAYDIRAYPKVLETQDLLSLYRYEMDSSMSYAELVTTVGMLNDVTSWQ